MGSSTDIISKANCTFGKKLLVQDLDWKPFQEDKAKLIHIHIINTLWFYIICPLNNLVLLNLSWHTQEMETHLDI